MTRDQIYQEHERLQRVLEAHEARSVEGSLPQSRDGLKKRIAALAEKLADDNHGEGPFASRA